MSLLTVHCLVKNEENFIEYAIKSVIDFVDSIIIFDTGSTDKTSNIIEGLIKKHPGKIIFEQKGEVDKFAHTQLRQEMIERTETDWFMILDGDEIWTNRMMKEVLNIIKEGKYNCIVARYYLCVGDIYHHSVRGKYAYAERKIHASPRVFKKTSDLRWNQGVYGIGDYIIDEKGYVLREGNYIISANKYWHASALVRSSRDGDVALGRHKQVMTYSLKMIGIGFKIQENIPEAFMFSGSVSKKLSVIESWRNLVKLILFNFGVRKIRY